MIPLDAHLLARFVDIAMDRLEGDWVLIGGTVLPLLGISDRVTLDIDIVGPIDAPQSATLVLMEIAEGLGLPPEAINQAAAFFLRRIKGWQDHVVPYRHGASGTLFRPDATLYVLLKLPRLSEADLGDCLAFLDFARLHDEKIDLGKLRSATRRHLRKKQSESKQGRLLALLEALERLGG